MKRIIFIILIFLLIILSIFNVDANIIEFPLIGKTIIIDAGHGGKDFGASIKNIKESEINLLFSLKLKNNLEKKGAVVLLTRKDSHDLSNPNALYRKKSDFDNRIKLINNSHADMYLSIHQNIYPNEKYYGPEVYYYPKINDNEKIAATIQKELNKYTQTNRQIKIITGTYMYDKLNIRGCLIECGFLSNDNERSKLLDKKYQDEFIKAITNSIVKYFSS